MRGETYAPRFAARFLSPTPGGLTRVSEVFALWQAWLIAEDVPAPLQADGPRRFNRQLEQLGWHKEKVNRYYHWIDMTLTGSATPAPPTGC